MSTTMEETASISRLRPSRPTWYASPIAGSHAVQFLQLHPWQRRLEAAPKQQRIRNRRGGENRGRQPCCRPAGSAQQQHRNSAQRKEAR